MKEPGLRLKSFDSKYLAVLSTEHLFASLLWLNYLGLKAPYEYMSSSDPFVTRGAFTQLPALKNYQSILALSE